MTRYSVLLGVSCLLAGCGGANSDSAPARQQQNTVSTAETEAQSEPPSGPDRKGRSDYEELLAAADELVQKGDRNHAVRLLTRAIAAEPGHPDAYIRRAAILAEAQLLPQAVKDISAAIQFQPENHKLRNTRGYFYLLLKDYKRAERDFNGAIDLNQEYPQAYNNRGLVFIAQDKHVVAINDFQIAIRLKPDYVDAYNNLGYARLQLEQAEEAVEEFSRALELDETYLNAWSNRGRAQLQREQYEGAIADFTRAIELQPENVQLYLHRSEAYKAIEKDGEASRDLRYVAWLRELTRLNQWIQQTPRNADLWVTRGRHLLRQNRLEEARNSFEQALKLEPAHARGLVGRAAVRIRLEEYEQAVQDCTQALEDQPMHEAYSLRGDAYFQLQEWDEAIADYEAARRFDSQVAAAYRGRARQREEAGESELASADSRHAALLEKRLKEKVENEEVLAPRAMVIEPASFEEEAP